MTDTEEKWMKRIKFAWWTVVTLSVIIGGIWTFVTSPFALADDLRKTDEKVTKVEEKLEKKAEKLDEDMLLMKIMIFQRQLADAIKEKDEAKKSVAEGELKLLRGKLLILYGG